MFAQWDDGGLQALRHVVRIVVLDPRGDSADFGLSLLYGHARLKARDYIEVLAIALCEFFGSERRRNPHGGELIQILKICRHHANHGMLLAIQQNIPANDATISAVAPLPQTMAEDRYFGSARLVFFGQKVSA